MGNPKLEPTSPGTDAGAIHGELQRQGVEKRLEANDVKVVYSSSPGAVFDKVLGLKSPGSPGSPGPQGSPGMAPLNIFDADPPNSQSATALQETTGPASMGLSDFPHLVGLPIHTVLQGKEFVHGSALATFMPEGGGDGVGAVQASMHPRNFSFFARGGELGQRLAIQAGARARTDTVDEPSTLQLHTYAASRDLRFLELKNSVQLEALVRKLPNLDISARELKKYPFANSAAIADRLGPYLARAGLDGYVLKQDAVNSTPEYVLNGVSGALDPVDRSEYEVSKYGSPYQHPVRGGPNLDHVMESTIVSDRTITLKTAASNGRNPVKHFVESKNGWGDERVMVDHPNGLRDIEDGPFPVPPSSLEVPEPGKDGVDSATPPAVKTRKEMRKELLKRLGKEAEDDPEVPALVTLHFRPRRPKPSA